MSRALKIGLVLDDSLDKTDGVQQYVLTLGQWLSAQGHEVHYIVGETKRRDLPHIHSMTRNVKVRFNGNRMAMPLPTSRRKIRQLLERERFDVLHIQAPYSPFMAARVIAEAWPRTTVVGTFHIAPNSRFVSFANRLLALWTRRGWRRFDTLMAVSPAAQSFAAVTYRVESEVVPNTIDLQPFFTGQAFARYANEPTIVFLGRLVERKGCQYLLQAVYRLQQTYHRPFRVVVCGGGPLEPELKKYVQAHKLGEIVEFQGRISEEDKPRFLASADIVTYPSTGGESFGIVILEAMAASRGVVLAGNNPGYASVLGTRAEALFDPRNVEAFATSLYKNLENASARRAARDWQREFVKQFDISVVGRQIVAIYEQALRANQNVQ